MRDEGAPAQESRGAGGEPAAAHQPEGRSRTGWRDRIRSALAQGGLVLHFQPIVRLDDGGVEWWEALLRMKEPQGGLLPPSEFLPHAAQCGLAPALDRWVVESVLRVLAERPGRRITANLSSQTLQDHEALSAIERAVGAAGPEGDQLMFEISETVAVGDLRRASNWIQRMKRLGCRFALDDFGAGASSFQHLRHRIIDVVKVDGSYIRQLLSDPSCEALVRAMSGMCRSLKMGLVAEGVESPDVAERLKRLGVRLGQGYLWGRPAPLDPADGRAGSRA